MVQNLTKKQSEINYPYLQLKIKNISEVSLHKIVHCFIDWLTCNDYRSLLRDLISSFKFRLVASSPVKPDTSEVILYDYYGLGKNLIKFCFYFDVGKKKKVKQLTSMFFSVNIRAKIDCLTRSEFSGVRMEDCTFLYDNTYRKHFKQRSFLPYFSNVIHIMNIP